MKCENCLTNYKITKNITKTSKSVAVVQDRPYYTLWPSLYFIYEAVKASYVK